jgi:hypothetical protein
MEQEGESEAAAHGEHPYGQDVQVAPGLIPDKVVGSHKCARRLSRGAVPMKDGGVVVCGGHGDSPHLQGSVARTKLPGGALPHRPKRGLGGAKRPR